MFRSSFHIGGMHLFRRMSLGILILAFSLGSAGQVTPVGAAPRADGSIIYRMKVTLPPDPLCAGHHYPVTVRISADQQYIGQDGYTHNLVSEGVNGIRVEAFAQDESIATPRPGTLTTGMVLGHDEPGQGTFDLQAHKAGSTVLFFEASIGRALASQQEAYFGAKAAIKVVNCTYRVTMKHSRTGPMDTVTGSMPGTLIESSDGQALTGEGLFTFRQIVTGLTPACTYSISTLQSPTGIKANIVDPNTSPLTLHLSFDYAAATQTTIAKCKLGQLGTAAGQDTRQEDPDWFLDLPAVDFQEPWGTKKFPTLNGGSMWITVVPVTP